MAEIAEYADLKPFAVSMIAQAVRDVTGPDVVAAIDAALWLISPDFETWSEAAGGGDVDPIVFLTEEGRYERGAKAVRRIGRRSGRSSPPSAPDGPGGTEASRG